MVVIYLLIGIVSLYLSICVSDKSLHRLGYYGIIILLALCYEGQLFIKLFVSFVFQSISIMVENCCALILTPLRIAIEAYGDIGFYFYYFVGIIFSNITIIILVRLICAWKNYAFVGKRDTTYPLYFPMLFLFPVCIMFIIDQYSLIVAYVGKITVLTIIPVLLLVAIAIVFFFSFDEMLRGIQNKQKMDVLQKQLNQELEYHKILLGKHQQFMQLRHDMRDDFNYVVSLIKNGAYQDALQFAEQKSGKLALTSAFQTGQPMLDTILTIKEEEARRMHVDFQSYILVELSQTGIAIEDLASLCSNILNNALEAVQQIEEEASRRIWCQLLQKKNFLYIIVRNTTAGEVKIESDILETTKRDKNLHGFGLSIIKNIVEKYEGSYSLEWADYIFTIKIVLSTREDENSDLSNCSEDDAVVYSE